MEREENIVLSVILIDDRNHFLAPLTIDSILNQQERCYEIIVVTQGILISDFNVLKDYGDKIKIISLKKNRTISQLRNIALKKARGKYVHYLFPGERYLSNHSFEYVQRKLNNKNPDLLCFAYLKRDIQNPPEVKYVSFALSLLGKDRYPLFIKDCLILKKSLVEIKGFDLRLMEMEGFDAILKIYLKKGSKVICCRRVLIDFELQKIPPKTMLRFISEIISVIYHRYGFYRFFHWPIIREMIDFFTHWTRGVKSYFLHE